MLTPLPPGILNQTIVGLRLPQTDPTATQAPTLANVLARPTLLVFLRHFGCVFCREMIHDLKRVRQRTPAYPPVVFFAQATIEEAEKFFARHDPAATVICDPGKRFYHAFDLKPGTAKQMFGPAVWTCGLRATLKGNTIGLPVGDVWTMPGVFLVSAAGIHWKHTFLHAGDHPNFAAIPQHLSQTA